MSLTQAETLSKHVVMGPWIVGTHAHVIEVLTSIMDQNVDVSTLYVTSLLFELALKLRKRRNDVTHTLVRVSAAKIHLHKGTYKTPTDSSKQSPYFCRLGTCNFRRTGTGRHKVMTSSAMNTKALTTQNISTLKQVPGIVLSQYLATGRQVMTVAMILPSA